MGNSGVTRGCFFLAEGEIHYFCKYWEPTGYWEKQNGKVWIAGLSTLTFCRSNTMGLPAVLSPFICVLCFFVFFFFWVVYFKHSCAPPQSAFPPHLPCLTFISPALLPVFFPAYQHLPCSLALLFPPHITLNITRTLLNKMQ